jgi:hypothetical protein
VVVADLFLTSNLTLHGILLGFNILNLSIIPCGFEDGTIVPKKKVFSSHANKFEFIKDVIFYPLDKLATTIYSSKIYS